MSRRRPRLLLDENIGLRVYEELKRRGYEVQTVIEELRGASDEEVLRIHVLEDVRKVIEQVPEVPRGMVTRYVREDRDGN